MGSSDPGRRWRSAYIVSPLYDWVFFLIPPLAALALGVVASRTDVDDSLLVMRGQQFTMSGLALGTFIHAHLVIVFFRSHGNRAILETHPYRFLLVPAVLLVGMMWSPWVAVTASVLATFWDVYHSGAQTFGFGRIYDARAGNDPAAGRTHDFILNQVMYAGPIVAGATMLDHVGDFSEYAEVGSVFFTKVPAFMVGNQGYFTWAILGSGIAFLIYYVWHQWRLHRAGRALSWQKAFLLVTTGVVSIYTWGFNTFGEAFLIMNVFHALQYFGIVWATEKKNMQRLFRLERARVGKALTLVLFLGLSVSYGLSVELFGEYLDLWWAITIVVSLMHFWYDGFIWSVRPKPRAVT